MTRNLLIVTQAVDTDNLALGFFHEWIRALAPTFDHIEVICLYEGAHALPGNVRVHSLGKERGNAGRLAYAMRFITLAWRLRHAYDAVLVHMNQEYVLIAGLLWRILRKPIYLWRNHYAGSWITDTAALLCAKVFCTSKHSYTARYRRTRLMPVGVDAERFMADTPVPRVPRSILFFGRIAPSKRPDIFVEALGILLSRGVSFIGSVYGSALPEHQSYRESLIARAEQLGLHDRVRFHEGVPNAGALALYAAHDIYVNVSPSGMFDKVLFEAAAAGCVVLATSDDFRDAAGDDFHFEDAASLADRIEAMLDLSPDDRLRASERLRALARGESLATLADRLAAELSEAR